MVRRFAGAAVLRAAAGALRAEPAALRAAGFFAPLFFAPAAAEGFFFDEDAGAGARRGAFGLAGSFCVTSIFTSLLVSSR